MNVIFRYLEPFRFLDVEPLPFNLNKKKRTDRYTRILYDIKFYIPKIFKLIIATKLSGHNIILIYPTIR